MKIKALGEAPYRPLVASYPCSLPSPSELLPSEGRLPQHILPHIATTCAFPACVTVSSEFSMAPFSVCTSTH